MEVRQFHNQIKKSLIREFSKDTHQCNLLDLACGRGGDLHKWSNCKLNSVLAIDHDYQSITEAKHRLSETNYSNIHFLHADVSSRSISDNIFKQKKLIFQDKYYRNFDMITIFFAIQYFFSSEDEIDNLIKLINSNLKPGGYFIGISPDETNILSLCDKGANEKTYDSDTLKISVIGNKCNFWVNLGDNSYFETFGESNEYLVNIDHLKTICKKYNLECKRVQNFNDIGIPDNIPDELKKFSKLYCSWVFYKPIQSIYFPSRPPPFSISNIQIEKSDMPMITKPHEALRINKAIKNYCKDINIFQTNIVDSTSGVGGDTINFSSMFKHVVSIEVDPKRYQRLCHNVGLYKLKNVTTVNSDCVKEFINYGLNGNILRCPILYIDAPWFQYKDSEIALSNWDIVTITKTVLEGKVFSLVILKLPHQHSTIFGDSFKVTRSEITRKMCIKFVKLK